MQTCQAGGHTPSSQELCTLVAGWAAVEYLVANLYEEGHSICSPLGFGQLLNRGSIHIHILNPTFPAQHVNQLRQLQPDGHRLQVTLTAHVMFLQRRHDTTQGNLTVALLKADCRHPAYSIAGTGCTLCKRATITVASSLQPRLQ